jgi:hypothetical protein
VAHIVEIRNVYRLLVGNPEGKRSLGRPRHRWEDIKMDFREIGIEGVDWIHMARNRDRLRVPANTVMNPRVP